MAFVNKRRNGLEIALSRKESTELGLLEGKRYGIEKAGGGRWLIFEAGKKEGEKARSPAGANASLKGTAEESDSYAEQAVLAKLNKADLKERVEGKFEESLGKEEKEALRRLVEKGLVVKFRLNEKYKKPVYKTGEEAEERKKAKEEKAKKSSEAVEKPVEEYCIETDGYLACRDASKAKALSIELREQIENGEIRGTKGFDGYFYVVENALYEKHRAKALKAIEAEKGIGPEGIAEKLGISRLLARIVCELLKEDGDIIEKRKDQFQAV